MSAQAPPPQTTVASEAEPGRRGPLRIAGIVASAAVGLALVALLAYGVVARTPDRTIDDHLARSEPVAAPGFRLAVLRRGSLGSTLTPKLAPPLADGWVSLDELRGTPVVLNIWASWCIPCRAEAPRLQRAWRTARLRGVLFLGLDMQDAPEDARRFMDRFGVDYLNVRDPTDKTSRRYGATGIPETYFISARGMVVGHVIGVVDAGQLHDGMAAAAIGRPRAASQGGQQRPAR